MTERMLVALCLLATAAGVLVSSSAKPADAVSKRRGLIAVERNDGLYVVPAAGGQPRRVAETLPGDGDPVWSPDGRRMSFDRGPVGNSDVWVVNADGSGRRQLTFSRRNDDHARWSPSGRWLAFQSTRHGQPAVYAVNVRTGGARRVTQPGKSPDWLPDRRILFAWGGDLYSVRPTGADRFPQATDLGGALAAVASKDGHEIVWETYTGIFTARLNGLGGRQLTADSRDDDPVFSPDGAWVAFDRGNSVYVIRADGSQREPQLFTIGCCPDWSFTASPP